MLRTLDSYIEDGADRGGSRARAWYRRNRRFIGLLAMSVVLHSIFYGLVLKLDVWVMRFRERGGARGELVKVIDVAPPAERLPELRRPPDPVERADIERLRFDPKSGDDVNLVARSPKAAPARGAGDRLPSAAQLETHLRRTRAPEPPTTEPVAGVSAPQPETPPLAQPPIQPTSPPPPTTPKPRVPASGTAPAGTGGGRSSEGDEPAALGMYTVQAQYMAYVRARIRQVNERIMPRSWIAEVLSRKVSADFTVVLGRGGRFISARLVRSSGYARLDDVARDAIYIASPFEGYPPEAGDTITLTVTVYYTPWR